MNESDNLVQETYALLDATLVETLENTEDILSPITSSVNYVDSMRAKIASIEAMYDITEELKDELNNLRMKVNFTVINAFCKEFLIDKDCLLETFNSNYQIDFIVEVLYRVFYMERRTNIIDYLSNRVYSGKNYFIKINKTPTTRKDIEYYSLRNELQLSNSSLYVLLINYASIAKDILGDDSTQMSSFIENLNITLEESEALTEVFACGDSNEAYRVLGENTIISQYFNDILISYKELLKRAITVNK